jgi:hypothetical protein
VRLRSRAEKRDRRDLVGEVDPRHPLPAASHPRAEPEAERQRHRLDRAAPACQHEAGAEQHAADAERLGRRARALPFDRRVGEEAAPRAENSSSGSSPRSPLKTDRRGLE